jgi:O-antigen/teichoic acid export membrane protein
MGVGGALTLVGKDVIRVLSGPGWEPAGWIFTFFGPGFGVMFVYGIHGWVHLSIGRADRWFRWGIIELIVTGLMFVLALQWGPVGIATSWSVSLWVLTIPALWYAGRPIDFKAASIVGAIWRYVAASVLAVCATVVITARDPSFAVNVDAIGAIVRIAEISLVFGALYVGAVILLYRGFAPVRQVAGLVREMFPATKPSLYVTSGAVLAAKQ